MKLYVDTAEARQIERLLATRLFSGVTCNPAILKAAGLGPSTAREFYACAAGAGAREIFLQTFGRSVEEQVAQALRYRELGPEVVVKVVCSATGLATCATLVQQGVPVLMTAIHDAKQTLPAMAAGATYVTPYLSDMLKAGRDALEQICTMQRILQASSPTRTKLLMAGLHDIPTMVRLAQVGIEAWTLTPEIADALLAEELTEAMGEHFHRVSVE